MGTAAPQMPEDKEVKERPVSPPPPLPHRTPGMDLEQVVLLRFREKMEEIERQEAREWERVVLYGDGSAQPVSQIEANR